LKDDKDKKVEDKIDKKNFNVKIRKIKDKHDDKKMNSEDKNVGNLAYQSYYLM